MERQVIGGNVGPSGSLGLTVIRGDGSRETVLGGPAPLIPPAPAALKSELSLPEIARFGLPRPGLDDEVNDWRERNFPNLLRGLWRILAARRLGVPHFYGTLYLQVLRGDGQVLDLGLASMRLVTDTGAGFIVDAFQNLVELENMKFHGFGTGGAAEAAANTALTTEETTQYNPDSTRPTGTTAEASAQVYQTVGTYSPDSGGTRAITEHGVFSQAATGGGVMIDRSLFAVQNIVAGSDSLQATYQLTVNSGN